MIIPAAMNYYSAVDSLIKMDSAAREDQRKEMLEAFPDATNELIRGIELGLAAARSILSGEPQIVLAGLKPSDLL